MSPGEVRNLLERAGIRYALIGAAAVAIRGYPRFTQDTDFLTTDRRVFQPSLWDELRLRGVPVDIRQGDFDDPLGGVVRIGTAPGQVDVVVGKSKWEGEVVERAEPLDTFAACGYKDLVDAASLLSLGPRDELIASVGATIARLPAEAQAAWSKLIAATR